MEAPFLFGAQYYRAPTPEPECWPHDLRRMRELGMNAVKFWAQWRWSHRMPDGFVFDDLDRLMDLADANGLRVTINTVLDVAPTWLYERYPDARQVAASGQVVEPYAIGHRQVGGHPGPCYNHPGALRERQRFMEAVVSRFAGHPALSMWDVWNEPEQSFQARRPDVRTLVCYCTCCRTSFLGWLQRKYGDLDRLNAVWGRCYGEWTEVEAPREPSTLTDFVDWREFHLDMMTAEAGWRLATVRRLDPDRTAYLHVVPNTMTVFSSVTCVDDFAVAELCDVFAATMNGSPDFTVQVVSAGRGKRCYNVESHVNYGSIRTHQRILGLEELRRDLLPQIGLGVRGFLFWQYRPEVLGAEAPAWGLVGLDGEDRPVTRAAKTFWDALAPHAGALLQCPPLAAEVGVWKSRRNEVFHFAADGSLSRLAEGVGGYVDALYWDSRPFRFISERMLEQGVLDGIRLLILPSPIYLPEREARSLDEWVRGGGVLLSEAHLASYNATAGRHSRIVPGAGLAQGWGIREADTTAVVHVAAASAAIGSIQATDDERKAASPDAIRGEFVPVRTAEGQTLWGADRYALLDCPGGARCLGWFPDGSPAVVEVPVGKGAVIYCGTNPGRGALQGRDGLAGLIRTACKRAGVACTLDIVPHHEGSVHVDLLSDAAGPRFLVLTSRAACPVSATWNLPSRARGLFTGAVLEPGQPVQVAPMSAEFAVFEA